LHETAANDNDLPSKMGADGGCEGGGAGGGLGGRGGGSEGGLESCMCTTSPPPTPLNTQRSVGSEEFIILSHVSFKDIF